MEYLHIILCMLLFISGLKVAFSTNPVESVLFLILAFCNAGAILILFNIEFLGLIFIIVYVGAIAVLFLFVIMMLNVKIYENVLFELLTKNNHSIIFIFFLVYFILIILFTYIKSIFYSNVLVQNNFISKFSVDNLNNIDVLGQILYNY